MRCQKIRQLLSCRLDGMIDDEQLNTVSEHLKNCRACRSYWRYLQADAKLLRDLPEIVPPTGFRDELRKRIEETELPKADVPFGKGRPFGLPGFITKPWFAGVAALLIFVFGITAFGDLPSVINEVGGKFQVSQSDPDAEQIDKNNEGTIALGKSSQETEKTANPDGSFKGDVTGSGGVVVGGESTGGRDIVGAGEHETSWKGRDKHDPTSDNHPVDSNPRTGKGGVIGEFYTTSGEQTIVIRNVKIRLAVNDLDTAIKQLNEVTDEHCVTLEKGETRDQANEMRYVICVPTAEMHNAVKKIEKIGRVIISVVENEDITKKYLELRGRINDLNAKIADLEDAVTSSETQEERAVIERQLGPMKDELNSCKYRLKGFDDAVMMATINLTLGIEQ